MALQGVEAFDRDVSLVMINKVTVGDVLQPDYAGTTRLVVFSL
jgi:flagellar biosynthesis regulator FlbT